MNTAALDSDGWFGLFLSKIGALRGYFGFPSFPFAVLGIELVVRILDASEILSECVAVLSMLRSIMLPTLQLGLETI